MKIRYGALLAALPVALAALTAGAQTPVLEAPAPPEAHPPRWTLSAGVRTFYLKDAAFDAFSNNDAFVQFSLAATGQVVRRGRLSLAAGVELDAGSSSDLARGEKATLGLIRLSAVAEGRYQAASRLYLFARLAPGFSHAAVTVTDASAPGGSEGTSFGSFSLDAGAGAALRVGALGKTRIDSWLIADGGYGWVPSHALRLAPSLGGDQDKAGTLDLGSLAARGGFFRIALALSYE
jgi:hypothetical protein